MELLLKSLVGLGEVQKVYRQKRVITLGSILLSLVFIVFGVMALFLLIFYKGSSMTFGQILILLCSSLICGYIGFASIRLNRVHWDDAAAVYHDGFAYVSQRIITTLKWVEITSIVLQKTNFRAFGVIPVGTVRDYRIVSDLADVQLTGTLDNVDELLAIIRKNVFPYMFNRLKGEFDTGKEIDFGSITINKNNIQAQEKKYPWAEFTQVTLNNGTVHFIARKRNPTNNIRLSLQYLENVDVLIALSNEWIKQTSFKGN